MRSSFRSPPGDEPDTLHVTKAPLPMGPRPLVNSPPLWFNTSVPSNKFLLSVPGKPKLSPLIRLASPFFRNQTVTLGDGQLPASPLE